MYIHVDIDECYDAAVEGTDLCDDDKMRVCENIPGSFKCVCTSGYEEVGRKCERELVQSLCKTSVGNTYVYVRFECMTGFAVEDVQLPEVVQKVPTKFVVTGLSKDEVCCHTQPFISFLQRNI